MSLRRTLLSALLFLCLSVAAFGQDEAGTAEKTPIQATDLYKIRELQDVAVAPGGRSIVYVVKSVYQRPDSAGGPTYRTHLFRVDAGGRSEPQQLTFGAEGAHSPAWHPSGDRLAFVRAVDGTPQVFILPMTGGEAYQLTDAEHGATAPAFSPGGGKLLFASRLPEKALRERVGHGPAWPTERPGRQTADLEDASPNPDGPLEQVRAYLAEERPGQPRVTTRLDLQGERDLEPHPTYRHLFTVRLPDSPPEPDAFPEATRLTEGFFSFGGGSWMPNGEQVVVSGAPVTGAHPDRVRDRDLYIVRTDGSERTRLLSMEGYALSSPRVSPEGEHVAFGATRLADAGYAQREIGLFRTDGSSEARLLTDDFDRSAGPPKWSPDGWHLYTTAPSEGDFPLYRLSPFAKVERQRARLRRQAQRRADSTAMDSTAMDSTAAPFPPVDTTATDTTATDTTRLGLAAADSARVPPAADSRLSPPSALPVIERLTAQRRGVRSFDVGRTSVFYVVTQPTNPYELYANTGDFSRARRLTAHNAAWLENRLLSTPEPFAVHSDTFRVEGWTLRPTTERKGRPAPLLVQIHGGPMAMWGPGEATMWHEFQYFAAQGYALVYSNPRGSGGYGNAFKRANYRDWGRGPARDVLAAADYAANLEWTDAERQVVTGGSYAGYLTAWILTQTDRFEAAAAQRGVYDLSTFLGEGNAWRLVPYHFGGFPWNAAPERDTLGGAAPPARTAPVLASGGLEGSGAPETAPQTETDSAAAFRAPDTSAAPAAAPDTAGPRFASPREALIANSPLTYADQIRTPLLIMHADEDLRTGVSQSEMLYKSLKILERPVEYVRYPEAGHDLSRTGAPAQRLDRILRMWAFFERYL